MNAFNDGQYMVRKKVFKLLGEAFHIYDAQMRVVAYSKMKAFKLKEDIRVYESEAMQQEMLVITARNIIDFSASYDVVDGQTGQKLGALRRKGLKSIIQDEWLFLDAQDRPIGTIKEDSTLLALVRRFLSNLVPQTFEGEIGGTPCIQYKRHFNPFILKQTITFKSWPESVDRGLGIAGAVLLAAIEGRQN